MSVGPLSFDAQGRNVPSSAFAKQWGKKTLHLNAPVCFTLVVGQIAPHKAAPAYFGVFLAGPCPRSCITPQFGPQRELILKRCGRLASGGAPQNPHALSFYNPISLQVSNNLRQKRDRGNLNILFYRQLFMLHPKKSIVQVKIQRLRNNCRHVTSFKLFLH